VVRGRLRLIERRAAAVATAYEDLAHDARPIGATYECEYAAAPLTARDAEPGVVEGHLRSSLEQRRRAELDRGITLVGPHRDELRLTIEGLDARYQASQGEQRTLALALRLAGHLVVRDVVGAAPVLLL